ncbi:MAG: glycosyltransferase [Candidatus Cloacimonetes bacterium]|nr:glycosyltransferase [Candidatus Cloacimonadota bacterium]
MKNTTLLIVCNSLNPDLIIYFKNYVQAGLQSQLNTKIACNQNIEFNFGSKNLISSCTRSASWDLKFFLDFFIALRLVFQMRKQIPAFTHFTTAHPSNLFLGTFLKILGSKLVFTIHDLTPHPGKKAIFIKIYNMIVLKVLADQIIVHNSKEAKRIDNGRFIFHPLSGFPEKRKTPANKDTILFFGRIDQYKGIENLIPLAEQMGTKLPHLKLVVAGKGDSPHFESLRSMKNTILYNGFIEEEMVDQLFSEALFTILPYNSATQSGVILLSYSYSVPVIGFDVGCLKEYIFNNTGLCTKFGDIDNIVSYIQNIESTKSYDSLVKSVESTFSQKYNVESAIKIARSFYDSLK